MKQLAQLSLPGPSGQSVQIGDPNEVATNFPNLGTIVSKTIPYIFAAAGIGLLLMIIFSGFQLMTSAGDSKKMEAGQQRLTNAIIGFIVILIAWWLTQTLGFITGIDDITNSFK